VVSGRLGVVLYPRKDANPYVHSVSDDWRMLICCPFLTSDLNLTWFSLFLYLIFLAGNI
jgi:hypothetical protein